MVQRSGFGTRWWDGRRRPGTDTRGAAGRMFYELPDGNIIVLASGGGTSVEALDDLYLLGGKPAGDKAAFIAHAPWAEVKGGVRDVGQTESRLCAMVCATSADGLAWRIVGDRPCVNEKFEHRLETNGAVQWNPGVYSPPRPWIHASDWDPPPHYAEIRGPIFLMSHSIASFTFG